MSSNVEDGWRLLMRLSSTGTGMSSTDGFDPPVADRASVGHFEKIFECED